MENILHNRLHASMFHHHLCRWRAHVAIGVNRPWISCCSFGRGSGGCGGASNCGRISCYGGNGCCGYSYGFGSRGDSGGGKFYFKYT
jgi:hypothetical protein